jgi:formate hydrogenlyase transcriptional activator
MNTLTRTGLKLGDSLRSPERLNLILGLTNRVVSKLDLPDLLQETSVSIRQVMQSDAVGVALPDPETGELRYCALDCPAVQKLHTCSVWENPQCRYSELAS